MEPRDGATLAGGLAVLYGLAVAFAGRLGMSRAAHLRFVVAGALVLLVALVALVGVPYLSRRT